MATVLESNKTKIAKRVIEVFEFFDSNRGKATVMDIVRRYNRPQSSTSELLASLVEMGLLYKDPRSRSYSPTPRLATIGTSSQPRIIRNGRLFEFMDRAAMMSGCSIVLLGVVGVHVQAFRMSDGDAVHSDQLICGASEKLANSVAGLLLLASQGRDHAGRVLWRLNAEAAAEDKFNHAEMCQRITTFQNQGYAVGEAGFDPDLQMIATLLPGEAGGQPLSLAAVYPTSKIVDSDGLRAMLVNGVRESMYDSYNDDRKQPIRLVANG